MQFSTILTFLSLIIAASAVAVQTKAANTLSFATIGNLTLGGTSDLTWTTTATDASKSIVLKLYSSETNMTWLGGWDFANDLPITQNKFTWSIEMSVPEGQYYIQAVDRATEKTVYGTSNNFYIQTKFTSGSVRTAATSLAIAFATLFALLA